MLLIQANRWYKVIKCCRSPPTNSAREVFTPQGRQRHIAKHFFNFSSVRFNWIKGLLKGKDNDKTISILFFDIKLITELINEE